MQISIPKQTGIILYPGIRTILQLWILILHNKSLVLSRTYPTFDVKADKLNLRQWNSC